MALLTEKDLQAIIWKYIGSQTIERLADAGAWKEFEVYAEQCLEAHERLIGNIAAGVYPVNKIQEEIVLADSQIANFLRHIPVGEGVSANLVLGQLAMKDPWHMIHQFRVLYLALMAFFRDRQIREKNPATIAQDVRLTEETK